MLSPVNLTELWQAAATLSAIEQHAPRTGPFLHVFINWINFESCALFSHAILASNSLDYKTGNLRADRFVRVRNRLHDATSQRIDPALADLDWDERAMLIIAGLANTQLWLQEPFGKHIATLHGVMQYIPDKYRSQIAALSPKNVDIPNVFVNAFKCTPVEYAAAALFLHRKIGEIVDGAIRFFMDRYPYTQQIKIESVRSRRTHEVFDLFFQSLRDKQLDVSFSDLDLSKIAEVVPAVGRSMQSIVSAFSADTEELREKMKERDFSAGTVLDRRLPLYRYPIVRLANGRLVIPDLRYFCMATTNSVVEPINEMFGNGSGKEAGENRSNAFSTTMGYVLEFYLQDLIEYRMPNVQCIRTPKYKIGDKPWEGADLLLFGGSDDWLILIEAKALRMNVQSFADPIGPHFQSTLRRAITSIIKAREKYEHMTAGLVQFSHIQDKVTRCSAKPPIVVSVVREAVYHAQQILMRRIAVEQGHALRGYPHPFCLMALDVFEHAVEISATTGESLYDICYRFWERSCDYQNFGPPAEHFDDKQHSEDASYREHLMSDLQSRIDACIS